MAGFFETLFSYQSPNMIFSDATTTPAIVAISNDNINSLRNSVNQAKNTLSSAQKSYNSLLSSKPSQYIYPFYSDNYLMYTMVPKNSQSIEQLKNPAYDTWQNQVNTQESKINDAKTALQKKQTALQDAIALQKGQIAAGNDAVNWGLTAKNAEAQGLNNAQQTYNGLMAQWANNFANTPAAIGNFSGGGK